MNQVATITQNTGMQTAAEIRTHVNRIQEVMQAVMKDKTHFGIIPGCDKPSLYKAGSEVLLTTFRIAVEPEVTDLSTPDEIRYLVRAVGRHQTTGIVVGIGIGECSSNEDKYKWRAAVCDEEFETAPEDRKRLKYAKGGSEGFYTKKQIRTEPADLANTILKMAKKRAQIDLTLTATAASDIFTQDVEDMPDGYQEMAEGGAPRGKPEVKQPQRKQSAPAGAVTEGQRKLLFARCKASGVDVAALCKQYDAADLDTFPKAKVNEALEWLEQQGSTE